LVPIDLHIHSTASDGTDDPVALVEHAHAAGIDTIGLTDHDATGGWAAATAALRPGMTLVPGAELSCEYQPADGPAIPMHLLAYLFDPDEPRLRERMDSLCSARVGRAEQMVDRMEADGLPITWGDVRSVAAGGTVGRPHIARALVSAGVVDSVDAAFAGPINSRSPYYVGKPDIPVFEAIDLVRGAGGVCVFAHPLRRGRQVDDHGIVRMAAAGLRGIEVDHPDHDAAARIHLAAIAGDLGLITTGSSDYHGTNKRTRIGACTTDPDAFAALVDPVRGRLLVA
jgi:predicted metal-dependent phosphoesterase TrpH